MSRLFLALVLGVALLAGCANGGSAKECVLATDCVASSTTCATATCSMNGSCASENAPINTPCTDSNGTLCNGSGQCVQCTDAERDCPVPASECEESLCNGGACEMNLVASGSPTSSQITGDCKSVVCDGAGSTMVIDADDPPDDDNDCTVDACASGTSTPTDVAAGTSCATAGGTVCGSGTKLGTCVECISTNQCSAMSKVCDTIADHFLCVTPNCTDLIFDGTETDTDCGGPTCSPCDNADTCALARDCMSGYCAGTTCAACTSNANCPGSSYCDMPTGTCKPDKSDGGTCNDDMQCSNGHCVDNVCCNATCTSGCMACTAAKKGSGSDGTCGVIGSGGDPDMECAGTYSCNGSGACQSCSDGAKNGAETDMDCGGPTCTKCVNGKMCTSGTDCMSGSCPSGTCVASTTCSNGVIESGEQCDDSNSSSSDGCSSSCQCEATRVKTLTSIGVSIPDDSYNGTLASMACVNVAMPAVTGCGSTVSSVNVVLGLNHTWVGDVVIKLVSPANTVVTLMNRPGFVEPADDGTSGFGNSGHLSAGFPVTFIAGAAASAENLGSGGATACQTDGICMYAPNAGAATAGTLASFNGQTIAGTWRLCIGDASGGDVGTIDRVSLTIGN